MKELSELERTIKAIDKAMVNIPEKVATVAVNFFKRRFIEQNWIDTYTQPWKPRKEDRDRRRNIRRFRGILTKTGRLRRSIRKIKVTADYIIIGTDVPYAKAHNEGFRGTVDVKEHTRQRTKKVKEQYRTRSGRERTRTRKTIDESKPQVTVKRHRRKMNIPQRRYMGKSAQLNRLMERTIITELNKIL